MIYLQRKLRCKFVGSDDYMPKDSEGRSTITRDKFIPVIGFEVRKREKSYEGKVKMREDIYYVVINDRGRPESIASFNCTAMIDDQAEWNFSKITDLLNNITAMAKVLADKIGKTDAAASSK